ncbi:MAG: BadF/BadG/BcrA/BcrD ATPase family protein [Ignavibacteriota bacterium]
METVAHTEAGLHFYDDVDVICDVGGQDIKIIILKNGRVKDFKLNTQCSAGNGYFLQSTAQGFNVPVEQYATPRSAPQAIRRSDTAARYSCRATSSTSNARLEARRDHGRVVQRAAEEYLAVRSQIPNLSAIGKRFLLQGGTQYNLAAVKAQVDFIESRFKGKDVEADVIVHEHCGEAGAIGAGLEAGRLWDNGRVSTFIGLDACAHIQYKTTREEATRCYFCKNKCLRTFIDVKTNIINIAAAPLRRPRCRLNRARNA